MTGGDSRPLRRLRKPRASRVFRGTHWPLNFGSRAGETHPETFQIVQIVRTGVSRSAAGAVGESKVEVEAQDSGLEVKHGEIVGALRPATAKRPGPGR